MTHATTCPTSRPAGTNPATGQNRRTTPLWRTVSGLKSAAIVAITALTLTAAADIATAEIRLTFGTYAADKPTDTVRELKPVLKALEESLSRDLGEVVTISTQIATDYDKGIVDLVQRRVDFAKFGPASYVTAKDASPGVTVLAAESEDGRKIFQGIICVREDSPIRTVADLRNKTFAFGNKLSTIGRFLAQNEMLNAGITASSLKHYDFLDRHDRVGAAVANGEFDAGALKSGTFEKLVKKGAPIRAIATFDNVTKPWIARAGLDDRLVVALTRALVSLDDPQAMKKLGKSGFLPATDGDYDIIRRAMKASRQFETNGQS
jgi:phosphonate transport system substrate-binding protein